MSGETNHHQQQPSEEEEEEEEEIWRAGSSSTSTLAADRDQSGCCGSCEATFRQEFHVRNFGFNFQSHEAFETSQWRWPTFVFVCYRLSAAIYSATTLIWTILKSFNDQFPWPTWMTNWSYTLLTLHLVYSAILALRHVCGPSRREKISGETQTYGAMSDEDPLQLATPKSPELPFHLKLEWFLFLMASVSAPIVTTTYWIYLAPATGVPFLQNDSINEHLVNTVLVVLELFVSAIPVRLLHFVYVSLFGLVYTVFTLIYWAVDHDNILYVSFTNWNEPTNSAIRMTLLLVVVVPLLQLVLFGIYQLRLILYRCIYDEYYTRPPLYQ